MQGRGSVATTSPACRDESDVHCHACATMSPSCRRCCVRVVPCGLRTSCALSARPLLAPRKAAPAQRPRPPFPLRARAWQTASFDRYAVGLDSSRGGSLPAAPARWRRLLRPPPPAALRRRGYSRFSRGPSLPLAAEGQRLSSRGRPSRRSRRGEAGARRRRSPKNGQMHAPWPAGDTSTRSRAALRLPFPDCLVLPGLRRHEASTPRAANQRHLASPTRAATGRAQARSTCTWQLE